MAEVHLPLVGGVSKKALLWGGIASAAVVAVIVIRRRSSAAAAPAATSGTGTDPNAIDPNTGLPYGQGGYQDTGLGPTYGATGYYDPNTGQWIYGNTGTGQAGATTNQQWAQMAEQFLIQNNGADPVALSAALGAYLTGRAVTSAQESLIDQAIAIEGYPPNGGPNGYPPGIRTQQPGHGGTVTVPHLVGRTAGDAHNKLVAAELVPVGDPGQKPHDKVTSTSPKGGTVVQKGSEVLITATPADPGGGGHHCPVGMHWDAEAGKCVSDAGGHHPPPGTKVRVPNVVGQSQENATDSLADVGLKTAGQRPVRGRVRIVTRQSPKSGAEVNRGSTVRLTTRLT